MIEDRLEDVGLTGSGMAEMLVVSEIDPSDEIRSLVSALPVARAESSLERPKRVGGNISSLSPMRKLF